MKVEMRILQAVALSCVLLAGCDRDAATTTPAQESDAAPDDDTYAVPSGQSAPSVSPARAGARAPAPVNRDSGLSFTDLDKNMDSAVTRDELPMSEMLSQHFNEADTSRDGKLSHAEIERHRMDMNSEPQGVITDGRSIVQMDTDGDGVVAPGELWDNEMLRRHFEEADADGDGKLSAAEIEMHRNAMATGQ